MKVGRRIKYKKDFPEKAYQLALNEASDKDIMKMLGIKSAAFYDYLNKYSEFSEAIKRGRKPIEIRIENLVLIPIVNYVKKNINRN